MDSSRYEPDVFPLRLARPIQKSAETPGVVARHNRKQAKVKALEDAYEVVNRRDGNKCRATGVLLDPRAADAKRRREHHHLRGRRVRPDWRERPERICLVSTAVHELINASWIDVEGTDARKPLFFHYTKDAKSKPLLLKRTNPKSGEE